MYGMVVHVQCDSVCHSEATAVHTQADICNSIPPHTQGTVGSMSNR